MKRRSQLQYKGPSGKNETTARLRQTKGLSSPVARVAEDDYGSAQEQSKHTVILNTYTCVFCGNLWLKRALKQNYYQPKRMVCVGGEKGSP